MPRDIRSLPRTSTRCWARCCRDRGDEGGAALNPDTLFPNLLSSSYFVMLRHIRFLICAFAIALPAIAQEKTPVFVSGEEGHGIYRIPSIISLPNGDLLAIAEGRVNGAADFGDINLVMKRSRDQEIGRASCREREQAGV